MVNYSCPRCVKVFAQKSHYKSHLNRKNPCQNNADKIKKLVEEEVTKKFQELKLINSKISNKSGGKDKKMDENDLLLSIVDKLIKEFKIKIPKYKYSSTSS